VADALPSYVQSDKAFIDAVESGNKAAGEGRLVDHDAVVAEFERRYVAHSFALRNMLDRDQRRPARTSMEQLPARAQDVRRLGCGRTALSPRQMAGPEVAHRARGM
jgi:hypothetical protein